MSRRDPRDEIFYQIMPIAWRCAARGEGQTQRARANSFGGFRGMTEGIGYLRELGVTSVWLNPIFPSLAYHGYQHALPDRVNEHLGTHEDFRTFVREAHRAGVRVLLDVVLYGTTDQNPHFRKAFADPTSGAGARFAFEDQARVRPHGSAYTTWTAEPIGFVHWDLRDRELRECIIESSLQWLRPHHGDDAVDGFRLDHVWPRFPRGPEGWGYNLEFWLEWKEAMRRERPDVWTIAEQADWGSYGADLLPAHDAVMSIPLLFAARRSLQAEHAGEFMRAIDETLLRIREPARVLGVLGNHDVDRLASSIGADQVGNEGRLRVALAMLILSPFAPCIYYGDELGLRGKRLDIGGDQNDLPVRQPMPWRRTPGEETSAYHRLSPIGEFELRRFAGPNLSVEEQAGAAGSTLEIARELINLRRETPALRRGSYLPLKATVPALWAFLRTDGGGAVVGCVNLGSRPIRETIPVPGRDDFEVEVPGFSWVVKPAPARNDLSKSRIPDAPPT